MDVDRRRRGGGAGATMTRGLTAIVLGAALAACSHQGGGLRGMLGLGSPGPASGMAYVDMDKIIQSHPLNGQLQAMQDQIAVLQQEATLVPVGLNTQQAAAYDEMQRDLAAASATFQQELGDRRDYYQRKEAAAIGKLQAAALGGTPGSGGVLSGLQQQFGQQAQALQKQALATLAAYRTELFRQDSEHLKQVQQLIAADARQQLKQRESQLSAAETRMQIGLVKADQEQRLNLQAKLQNLALSDKERAQYQAQLKAIDAAEQVKINAMKASDGTQLAQLERDLNAKAAARYDAERKATQAATQAKLVARQKEMQTAINPQMQALSGKFQQQLNDANAKLAGDDRYKAQAQTVHEQMQSGYMAEAAKAETAYRQTRASLIAKYSAIAHVQFQDNETIAAQADKIAADRRDLYQRISDQVRAQVAQIAQQDGIAVVFSSIRASGSAVDLTDQVSKAIRAVAGASSSPAASASGGP